MTTAQTSTAPHNDPRPTEVMVQSETGPEPKKVDWPTVIIIAGLIGNLAWVGLLGWLVVQQTARLFS